MVSIRSSIGVVLFFVALATAGAGEPPFIAFETFQKEFETEPLDDHHSFTERAKSYFAQIQWIEAKKFSSPKEKAALQKMKSAESLTWVIERIDERMARIKANPADPTLQLTDVADLDLCLAQARHYRDPKKNPLPPPTPPVCPKLRVDPRSKAKLMTQNDWKRVVVLLERYIKHVNEKKYDNIFALDLMEPPANKEAAIAALEKRVSQGELAIIQAFLQCRDNAFICSPGYMVVSYVASERNYFELILDSGKTGEMRINYFQAGVRTANSHGVFILESKK